MSKSDILILIFAFIIILTIPILPFLFSLDLSFDYFRDEPSRVGDYWYSAPDGIYWAYTSCIWSNITHNYASFAAPTSSATQLHCGPFGWNVDVAYNFSSINSTKIHLVLVNNTVVEIR